MTDKKKPSDKINPTAKPEAKRPPSDRRTAAKKRKAAAKMITVRAGKDLMVHFPMSTIAAPGARTKMIQGDETVQVPASDRFVAKRIKVGDLVVVKQSREKNP